MKLLEKINRWEEKQEKERQPAGCLSHLMDEKTRPSVFRLLRLVWLYYRDRGD
jgi:hypothetical protein